MIYTLTLNPAVDRELTVPAIEYDSVLRASRSQVDFGGKGFNVSRLLKGLGADTTAVGFVGGKAGETLQDGLQALEIQTDFVWIPGETRTNISIVTENGGHYIKVNEKGPLVGPDKQRELLEKVHRLAEPGDWWVLAGSLPQGVPADFYAQIVRALNECGAKALLDTIAEPLRLGCQEKPFLVKPNTEEAHSLTGLPAENSCGDRPGGGRGAPVWLRECGDLDGQGRGAAAHQCGGLAGAQPGNRREEPNRRGRLDGGRIGLGVDPGHGAERGAWLGHCQRSGHGQPERHRGWLARADRGTAGAHAV